MNALGIAVALALCEANSPAKIDAKRKPKMSIGTILLIFLIILLLGGFSGIGGSHFYGFGNGGGISVGAVFVIVLVLVLLGKL